MEKYKDKIDICLGEWSEKGKINSDMAVHKLDASMFMTEKENKNYMFGPIEPVVAPKMFDLSKASRVKMTKDDLEMLQKGKQAEMEEAI